MLRILYYTLKMCIYIYIYSIYVYIYLYFYVMLDNVPILCPFVFVFLMHTIHALILYIYAYIYHKLSYTIANLVVFVPT